MPDQQQQQQQQGDGGPRMNVMMMFLGVMTVNSLMSLAFPSNTARKPPGEAVLVTGQEGDHSDINGVYAKVPDHPSQEGWPVYKKITQSRRTEKILDTHYVVHHPSLERWMLTHGTTEDVNMVAYLDTAAATPASTGEPGNRPRWLMQGGEPAGLEVTAQEVRPEMPPGVLQSFFAPGDNLTVEVFLSRSPDWANREYNHSVPLWQSSVVFAPGGELSPEVTAEFNVTVDEWLLGNESLWAHSFLYARGATPDKKRAAFDPRKVVYARQPLVRYFAPDEDRERSLWGDDDEAAAPVAAAGDDAASDVEAQRCSDEDAAAGTCAAAGGEAKEVRWQARWQPALTLCAVEDMPPMKQSSIPPQLISHVRVHPDGKGLWPIFWSNDFWVLSSHYIPINDTLKELPLRITYTGQGFVKFAMFKQMEESWTQQQKMGLQSNKEKDEMKRMLLETNPILLGATAIVSLLHTVFNFLAFKNDISFWRNQQSMKGLSMSSIALNCFSQTVICLYLWDNDTSWMVLLSVTVGVVIEFWKLSKAVEVTVDRGPAEAPRRIPRLRVGSKGTYKNSGTVEFDQKAARYLMIALAPCLVVYTGYSLMYNKHKGVYSFVIKTLVQFIYWFGFVMMTPQLFINYKLKSVAHLPWKAFTYKALGTFIDDLFAFIIKMPMAHRLACFRDDVIFVIFLFQYWQYKVDKTRVNEFGQCGLDEVPMQELQDRLKQWEGKPESTERTLHIKELRQAIEYKTELLKQQGTTAAPAVQDTTTAVPAAVVAGAPPAAVPGPAPSGDDKDSGDGDYVKVEGEDVAAVD